MRRGLLRSSKSVGSSHEIVPFSSGIRIEPTFKGAMKKVRQSFSALLFVPLFAAAVQAQGLDTAKVDQAIGRSGQRRGQ